MILLSLDFAFFHGENPLFALVLLIKIEKWPTMKLFLSVVTLLFLCRFSRSTAHDEAFFSERQLDAAGNPMWFLVSQISKDKSWCITVTTGDTIKLRRCDFNAAKKNQLWSQSPDGKLHSALDNRKCMDFNPYESDRVRLEYCSTSTRSTTEFAGFSSIGPIKELNDERYCLTNRGINPNPSDPILVKECLDRPDYKWEVVPSSSTIGARRVMIRGSSGCLQPRHDDRRRVYLDECDEELAWYYELLDKDLARQHELLPQTMDGFLLRSALDDSLCLRAGRSSRLPKDGTWMRLVKCDHLDAQQHVVIGPSGTSLHVANIFDFCIEHAGINPNVGKDIIVILSCDASNPAKPWHLDFSVGDRQCVSPDVPAFVIDDNVNIGDTLLHPGPGFARSCGMDCYRVKDSGDDPPFDPELGDTLRFAYKKVSGRHFSLRSKVCGVNCDGCDGFDGPFGRTGLMVRESLDPLAKNIFASHSPNGQADWSYRSEYGESTLDGFDGSPDVPCLWITLERNNDDFLFSYAYEGQDECDMEPEFLKDLNGQVTIDMPDDVFVGLAVSTDVREQLTYTEAEFRHIECDGCESSLL